MKDEWYQPIMECVLTRAGYKPNELSQELEQ